MKFNKALLITAMMFSAVCAQASSQDETAETETKKQVIVFSDAEADYVIVGGNERKPASIDFTADTIELPAVEQIAVANQ